MPDAGNTDFLLRDCPSDAFKPFNVGPGISALASGGLAGKYQTFSFV